jgi:hypothetical protein
LLLFLPPPLPAQQAPPRFMYIYRDSLKQGVDSTYRVLADEGAQICADLKCPNSYLAIQGFGVYRPDLSRSAAWSLAGARFMLVTVTRSRQQAEGAVWEMADSTLYILRPVRTRRRAAALAAELDARVFAVRPNWSMPAPEWVAADPGFWRLAPSPRPNR